MGREKIAVPWENLFMIDRSAIRECADQPAHLYSLINVIADRSLEIAILIISMIFISRKSR